MPLLRSIIIAASWLPPALWIGAWLYTRQTDGWGAFAAAPVLIFSIWSSAVLVVAGGALLIVRTMRKEKDILLALAVVIAGSVFVYASFAR